MTFWMVSNLLYCGLLPHEVFSITTSFSLFHLKQFRSASPQEVEGVGPSLRLLVALEGICVSHPRGDDFPSVG